MYFTKADLHVQSSTLQVLKLDIDNSGVEMQFMHHILNSPALIGRISEMMFEMHYNSQNVNQWFGPTGGTTQWAEVFTMFAHLRQQGLALHYWP